jgi:hypothetical protein
MLLSVFLFGEVAVSSSAIIDNRSCGKVGDFLKEHIKGSSRLSFVSAYFTIYAYERLKEQLDSIDHLDFLFGEPRFVKSIDPDKTDKKAFSIVNDRLTLSNQLQSLQMKPKVDAMEVDVQRLLQVVDPEGKGAVFWEYGA